MPASKSGLDTPEDGRGRRKVWRSAGEGRAAEEEDSARRAAADAHVVSEIGDGEDGLAKEDVGAHVVGAALEDGSKLHVDILQLKDLREQRDHHFAIQHLLCWLSKGSFIIVPTH